MAGRKSVEQPSEGGTLLAFLFCLVSVSLPLTTALRAQTMGSLAATSWIQAIVLMGISQGPDVLA